MHLTYSFKCFLIITITDTKIKRHEKVRTIIILRDDPEYNKFQKNSKAYVPLNVIDFRLLEDFYIIKSGTSKKKLGIGPPFFYTLQF